MWRVLINTELQGSDVQFIGLLALAIFVTWMAVASDQRLMGVSGSVLGIIIWWALGGFWLDMQTGIPGLAWIFYAMGVVCFLLLIYGVFGYLLDRRGVLIGESSPD